MQDEKRFMGGEQPMHEAPEAKETAEEIELTTYGELLTQVGELMTKVIGRLEKERELAAEVRALGAKVTRETAERILGLERQKNELLRVYTETLEPLRKEAALAVLEKEEVLVPKSEVVEAMLTQEDDLTPRDEEVIETQDSEDLQNVESDLRTEADAIQEEMHELVDQMNQVRENNEASAEKMLRDPDPEMVDDYVEILRSHFMDLHNQLRAINAKLGEVRLNLGMARRLEGREAA